MIGELPAMAVVVGSMLGVGIFLAPPLVAQAVASPLAFLLVWVAAGVFAVGGAVAYSELGAMVPHAGGDYVFQRVAFGPSAAFATGLVLFGAVFAGSIAAMAVGLCQFQVPVLFGVDLAARGVDIPLVGHINGTRLLAILLVVAVTAVNAAGARPSAHGQLMLAAIPLVLLTGGAIWALAVGGGAPLVVDHTSPTLYGVVLAYMSAYFAFSGWNAISYVAGEVVQPQRVLPRAMLRGTLIVGSVYLLLCVAMVRVLGMAGLRQSDNVGVSLAEAVGSPGASLLVAFLIALAILASLNGSVFGGARIAFAMGRDATLWPSLGRSGRNGAPVRALWLQAAWAVVLILTGSFEQILHTVSLAMVLTGTMTVLALFVLRRRLPNAHRPYRATGYPWLPGVYLASNAVVIVVLLRNALATDGGWQPLLGLGLLVAAYVGHRVRLSEAVA